MTDAQHLIDYARTQFNEIAADVERHFDQVAGHLKDRFARSVPYAQPVRRLPPPTTLQSIQRWIGRNRALTAAVVAFLITGSVGSIIYIRNRDSKRKRRARKSSSGARTDVVVLAGAVANPLTSALYLDLERRGFVVYVVSTSAEDEHYIRSQMRADLLPLPLDLIDPFTASAQVARFQSLLAREHTAFEGAEPHRLRLVGLLVVPDVAAAAGPTRIADISSEDWSDALNAKILTPIAATQLLLPAVCASPAARVLLVTPAITPALRPPGHAIESTVAGALSGFYASLGAELAEGGTGDNEKGVAFSHLKLGNVDIPAVTAKLRREGLPAPRLKPTPLREVHEKVFDVLVAERPARTVYVGRGSRTYDLIGTLAPPAWIGWMMGLGRGAGSVREVKTEDLQGSAGSLTWEKVEQEG